MVSCSVVQGVQSDFTSKVKSQGTQAFHVETHLVSSANTFQRKVFSLEGLHILDSIPLCFGLFGQVPPRFFAHSLQRHRCTRTIRPRKINVSTSDVLHTSVTSGPAPVLVQRRDFQRRKPSVAVARESDLRRTKTRTPAGKTRAAVIRLFSLRYIKLYASITSCGEHEEIPVKHKNVPLRQ